MKHLLTLTELSKTEITQILDVASQMRRMVTSAYKMGPQLLGSTVAALWKKPTAESNAFALAAGYLSGVGFQSAQADNVLEQCRALDEMGVSVIAVSCENDNLVRTFSKTCRCGVINGGSSQSDPVGVLADLMTISAKTDTLSNLSVVAVGNRDCNKVEELNYCLSLFNSGLVWYLPQDDFASVRRGVVVNKPEAAFAGADAVVDLGLAAFSDPQKHYGTAGGIDEKLLDLARINVPLLGTRNFVDKTGIREYPYNAVSTRNSCYVAVAMAVLYLMKKA